VESPGLIDSPVIMKIIKKYFIVTYNPNKTDITMIFIQNPSAKLGYHKDDVKMAVMDLCQNSSKP